MSREDLDEALRGLERRAGDPQIRRAIRTIATSDSAWVEAFQSVLAEIVEPAFPHSSPTQILAQTDRVLNKVAWLVFTSTNPQACDSRSLG